MKQLTKLVCGLSMVLPIAAYAGNYSTTTQSPNFPKNNPYGGLFITGNIGFAHSSGEGQLYGNTGKQIHTFNISKSGVSAGFGAGYRYAVSPQFLFGAGINVINTSMTNTFDEAFNYSIFHVKMHATAKPDTSYAPYIELGYVHHKYLMSLQAGLMYAKVTTTAQITVDGIQGKPLVLDKSEHGYFVGANVERQLTDHFHMLVNAVFTHLPSISGSLDHTNLSKLTIDKLNAFNLSAGLSYSFN